MVIIHYTSNLQIRNRETSKETLRTRRSISLTYTILSDHWLLQEMNQIHLGGLSDLLTPQFTSSPNGNLRMTAALLSSHALPGGVREKLKVLDVVHEARTSRDTADSDDLRPEDEGDVAGSGFVTRSRSGKGRNERRRGRLAMTDGESFNEPVVTDVGESRCRRVASSRM